MLCNMTMSKWTLTIPSTLLFRMCPILAANCSSKILTPSESLGAVTSGAVLPSHPNRVYLGHEGGFVSVWTEGTDTFDSGKVVPVYVGIVKISNSDVLALEGVLGKLWTGSRSGVIAAYSVDSGDERSERWRTKNAWRAHEELPVSWITLDPFSIAKYHLTTHHCR
ncbi:hypothetical protein BU17DRAFT_90184 [Hysterangium stoloniferum]|nr:hypothetical protein BU17DRAFT_90184 [Hysterangium stoloniferum]